MKNMKNESNMLVSGAEFDFFSSWNKTSFQMLAKKNCLHDF